MTSSIRNAATLACFGFFVALGVGSVKAPPPKPTGGGGGSSATGGTASSPTPPAPPAPDLRVSPDTLVADYDGNEIAADQKYKGKILELSGVVDDVGKDLLDTIYLTLETSHPVRGVQVYFSDADADAIAALRKGQRIVVRGRCDGLMMNVLIKDAVLVPSTAKDASAKPPTPAEAPTGQTEAVLEIAPEILVAEYDGNEVAADQKYKGKTLRLRGAIDDIGKDLLDKIYITLESGHPLRRVQVFFDSASANQVAALRKGQVVVVEGRCDGLMMHVLLRNARLR